MFILAAKFYSVVYTLFNKQKVLKKNLIKKPDCTKRPLGHRSFISNSNQDHN